MSIKLALTGAIAILTAMSALADGMITTSDSPRGPSGTRGGEFWAVTDNDGSFYTYCIEAGEFFTPGSKYYYSLSLEAKYNATTSTTDPISMATAWVFAAFATGNLKDGTTPYNPATQADQDALQKLLWYLEGEAGGAQGKYYDDIATAYGEGVDYNGSAIFGGNVQVVNVWGDPTHTVAQQDVLKWTSVPDGGATLALLGISMGGLAFFARRKES